MTQSRYQQAAAEAAIAQSFMRYAEAFRTLDPKAVLAHLHVPFVLVDRRRMRVMSSEADVRALVRLAMSELAAQGYERTEIKTLDVCAMSARSAIVSVAKVRHDADGNAMERLGETYTLLRNEAGEWRIAVALVHDAGRTLRAAPAKPSEKSPTAPQRRAAASSYKRAGISIK